MYLKKIHLTGFRNIETQDIFFTEGTNVLVGKNGQGKTNILEAIHMLATLKSFRGSRPKDMIQHKQIQAEIRGTLIDQEIPQELRVRLDAQGRHAWMNNKVALPIKEYLGRLKVVAFTPDDLSLVKGSPSLRRRWMDRSVFLLHPNHWSRMKEFNIALKNRNRLLKGYSSVDLDQLDCFSQKMAEVGFELSRIRKKWLEKVEKTATHIFKRLFGKTHNLRIQFKPGWGMGSNNQSSDLLAELRCSIELDLKRKQTLLGPQQDDFEILVDSQAAKRFSSQGQQRLVSLSLVLAIVNELIAKEHEHPLILLDDVSSELDQEKREFLFSFLEEQGRQVIITTTEKSVLGEYGKKAQCQMQVEAGKVISLSG